MGKIKEVSVLNLCEELPLELSEYFNLKEIRLLSPSSQIDKNTVTHILTNISKDFNEFAIEFKTITNNIPIITLSPVIDYREFILSNGKLCFDKSWMKSAIGPFILDKFFQSYFSSGTQPIFQEKGRFIIVNPFSTGDYLDKLVHQAFQERINGLSVKLFFDHFIMYLAGLKNKSKIGYPIEVIYGSLDDIFSIQFSMPAESLIIRDLTSSISNNVSREPEKNLLNSALCLADFFDLTLLSDAKKLSATCLWSTDQKIKIQNNSFMLNELGRIAKIPGLSFNEITDKKIEVKDNSDKIILPDDISEPERILGSEFTHSVAHKIVDKLSIEEFKKIIKSSFEDGENLDKLVKGRKEEDNEVFIVRGYQDQVDEVIKKVSSRLEDDSTEYKIPGSNKFDFEKYLINVSSSFNKPVNNPDLYMKVQTFQQSKLKDELKNYAFKLGKDTDVLTNEDVMNFNTSNLPLVAQASDEYLQKMLDFKQNINQAMIDGLFTEFGESNAEQAFDLLEQGNYERLKSILTNGLIDNLNKKFDLSTRNRLNSTEGESIAQIVSSSVQLPAEQIRNIINDEKKSHLLESKPLGQGNQNSELDKFKFDKINDENQYLKQKMVFLMNELKVLKDTKKQLQRIDNQVVNELPNLELIIEERDSLNPSLIQNFKNGEKISSEDMKKLSSVLEKEARIIETFKDDQIKNKRLILEMDQKNMIFEKHIEQLNRQLRAKELVMTKTKESFSNLIDKKNNENSLLRDRISFLNQQISNTEVNLQTNQFRILENQNLSLTKMIEIYKDKISELSSQIQRNGKRSDENVAREEERKNQMIISKLKQQLEAAKNEAHFFQEKHTEAASTSIALRNEKIKLEQQLKKISLDSNKKEEAFQTTANDPQIKKLEVQISLLEAQLKEATNRARDFENKLRGQVNKKQEPSLDEAYKKINHLDASIKKLSQDLLESRNQQSDMKKELIKLKTEKTGLQHLVDALKKELEKAKEKAASQKKSGGKAA